jgi:hypothetical protein
LVRLGFNGSLDDTLLLQPELDDNGNPTDWYVARWRTPDIPSDFYMDVIVRDRAGNEFIYDNISGFTTQQFTLAHTTSCSCRTTWAGRFLCRTASM